VYQLDALPGGDLRESPHHRSPYGQKSLNCTRVTDKQQGKPGAANHFCYRTWLAVIGSEYDYIVSVIASCYGQVKCI
jgi:hypothetical protein